MNAIMEKPVPEVPVDEFPLDEHGLIVVDALSAAVLFRPGNIVKIVETIEKAALAVPQDASTEAGREAIKQLAGKVVRSKTAIDEMRKTTTEEWRRATADVNAAGKIAETRLSLLRDRLKAPVIAYERKEMERRIAHETALATIKDLGTFAGQPSAADVQLMLDMLANLPRRDWEEYENEAVVATMATTITLEKELAAAMQREADAAELDELRKLKAERDAEIEKAAEAKRQADAKAAQEAEIDRRAQELAKQKIEEAASAAVSQTAIAAADAAADRVAARPAATYVEPPTLPVIPPGPGKDAEHRATCHRAMVDGIVRAGNIRVDAAKAIVTAVVQGRIPHVAVNYGDYGIPL